MYSMPTVFTEHAVRSDDIQTFGHDRMKTVHQLPLMLHSLCLTQEAPACDGA